MLVLLVLFLDSSVMLSSLRHEDARLRELRQNAEAEI
jgi:hypothetical protein